MKRERTVIRNCGKFLLEMELFNFSGSSRMQWRKKGTEEGTSACRWKGYLADFICEDSPSEVSADCSSVSCPSVLR